MWLWQSVMRSVFFAAPILSVIVFVAMVAFGSPIGWALLGFFLSGSCLVLVAALLGYGASLLARSRKDAVTTSKPTDPKASS